MGAVATTSDPNWPSAATLLSERPVKGRRNVGLLGISTYATSVSPRSATSTPAAIRAALERYSTWSFSEAIDIAESVGLVDFGDVSAPDAEGGAERVAVAMAGWDPSIALRLILGGDNAATWHALRALSGGDYSNYGLVTLDAHLDMRDGRSNGSPVRPSTSTTWPEVFSPARTNIASMSDIRAPSNTGVAIGTPFFRLPHSSINWSLSRLAICWLKISSP